MSSDSVPESGASPLAWPVSSLTSFSVDVDSSVSMSSSIPELAIYFVSFVPLSILSLLEVSAVEQAPNITIIEIANKVIINLFNINSPFL